MTFPLKNISTLDEKASNQLNAISRLQKFMGFKEEEFFVKLLCLFKLVLFILSSRVGFLLSKISKKDTRTSYSKILNKSGKSTREVKRRRALSL